MFIYGLAFVILLISIALNIISSFIIYLVTLYVLVYVSPIFIPMVLFNYTKKYFDGWANLLLSCVIQPFIVVSFLAFAITMFDTSLYGTCKFTGSNGSYTITNGTDPGCSNTFGYNVLKSYEGDGWHTKKAFLFSYYYLDANPDFAREMSIVAIFFIIFFYLLKSTNSMAAALTGGIDISAMTISATSFASSMKSAVGGMASGIKNQISKNKK
jgi:type IV secretion system protein VirB6